MMKKILYDIDNVKHIMILSDNEHLPIASALYTHLLRLHKKVSLVLKSDQIDTKFSFLPWYDKIKASKVTSCDFVLDINFNVLEFYNYLKDLQIKINPKMATALYGGLIMHSEGFLKNISDGIIFAASSELLSYGADYKSANEALRQSVTLSFLRLKAIMLKEMLLENSATRAVFYICDDYLSASGATIQDCDEIMREPFKLPHVKEVVLLDKDMNNSIIKKFKKEID